MTLLLNGAGAGLGWGPFGIMPIIRLRSDTLTQKEAGYYLATNKWSRLLKQNFGWNRSEQPT